MHINTKMRKLINAVFDEIAHEDNLCQADKLHWLRYMDTNIEMTENLIRYKIEKENLALQEKLAQE